MIPDLTTSITLLTFSSTFIDSGATYRHSKETDMNACQYWQPPNLNYMNSQYSKYITGVGSALWESSKSCGQCLEVKNNDKTVIVVIGDYCPL